MSSASNFLSSSSDLRDMTSSSYSLVIRSDLHDVSSISYFLNSTLHPHDMTFSLYILSTDSWIQVMSFSSFPTHQVVLFLQCSGGILYVVRSLCVAAQAASAQSDNDCFTLVYQLLVHLQMLFVFHCCTRSFGIVTCLVFCVAAQALSAWLDFRPRSPSFFLSVLLPPLRITRDQSARDTNIPSR